MATYSSILAGEIPWMEVPGRLQLMELHELDLMTSDLETKLPPHLMVLK